MDPKDVTKEKKVMPKKCNYNYNLDHLDINA